MRIPHLLVALGVLLPCAGTAQQEPAGRTLRAERTPRPPVIDGKLGDQEWAAAPPAGAFIQTRPRAGVPASQDTEVRILFDEKALYVGVRNRDTHPDSIVARLARRDQEVYSDWFTVLIDSYHDRRTAFAFSVNPRGIQRDYVIVNDTEEDAGWDAVWEVATARDREGWTAEYRIPLSQLRFEAGSGQRPWGINFARGLARRDELSYWSPVAPEAAGLVSQFGTLEGFLALSSPRGLELAPYTVARAARTPGDRANPLYQPTDLGVTLGADLKYRVTSALTLSATLNPDFGQVEADPSEVNLSANESRFEEKRPFFTEGADLFGVGFPEIFYPRRIGATPRGRVSQRADFTDTPPQTTIVGAAKLTGKTAGGWSVGVMDAVTARESGRWADTAAAARGEQVVEPLANYFTARVLRELRGGSSAVGAILTSVIREDDAAASLPRPPRAYVAGLDGRHRFGGGNFEANLAVLGSRVGGSATTIAALQQSPFHAFARPDATHLRFDSTRTSLSGYGVRGGIRKSGGGPWRWNAGGIVLSPGFEGNDLGFIPWVDRARQWVGLEYVQFTPGRLFRSWTLMAGQAGAWTFGGERNDLNARVGGRFQLNNHWRGAGSVYRYASSLNPIVLRGGSALRESGGTGGSLQLGTDTRRATSARVEIDGWREDERGGGSLEISPTVAVRPSDRAEFSAAPSLQRYRTPAQFVGRVGPDASPEYIVGRMDQTTSSITFRVDYTFSPALSLQLYAEPFLSAGKFSEFRRVRHSGAPRFGDRFHTFGPGEISSAADGEGPRHRVDLDVDGRTDLEFGDPGFNVRRLSSNAVLRWEYRPGSTLFVVWGQARDDFAADGRYHLRRDAASLFRSPASNVLMVKGSYWLSL